MDPPLLTFDRRPLFLVCLASVSDSCFFPPLFSCVDVSTICLSLPWSVVFQVRRLYDIANILSSLRLIRKIYTSSKRPAFRWLGVGTGPAMAIDEDSTVHTKQERKRSGGSSEKAPPKRRGRPPKDPKVCKEEKVARREKQKESGRVHDESNRVESSMLRTEGTADPVRISQQSCPVSRSAPPPPLTSPLTIPGRVCFLHFHAHGADHPREFFTFFLVTLSSVPGPQSPEELRAVSSETDQQAPSSCFSSHTSQPNARPSASASENPGASATQAHQQW